MQFLFIILIGSFLSNHVSSKQDFQSEVKKLFYGANLDGSYEDMLAHFNSSPYLQKDTSAKWTVYPPLSRLGEVDKEITSRSFTFHQHVALLSIADYGSLTLSKCGDQAAKERQIELSIYLKFNSKKKALEAYKKIIKRFKKYKPYTDKSLLVMPYAYHMYADSSEKLGIGIVGNFADNYNSITINLLH